MGYILNVSLHNYLYWIGNLQETDNWPNVYAFNTFFYPKIMQQVGLFKPCLVKIWISLGILDKNPNYLKHITHIVPLLGSRSSEAVDPQGGRVLLRPPPRARASGHALVPRRRRFLSARYDICKPKHISDNLKPNWIFFRQACTTTTAWAATTGRAWRPCASTWGRSTSTRSRKNTQQTASRFVFV